MTSDSYSRYLRSSHYKEFLEGAKKKSTRSFPGLPKLTSSKMNNMLSGTGANWEYSIYKFQHSKQHKQYTPTECTNEQK